MRNLKKKKKSSFIPNNLLNLRDIHRKIWSSKSKEEHPDSISEPQAEFGEVDAPLLSRSPWLLADRVPELFLDSGSRPAASLLRLARGLQSTEKSPSPELGCG